MFQYFLKVNFQFLGSRNKIKLNQNFHKISHVSEIMFVYYFSSVVLEKKNKQVFCAELGEMEVELVKSVVTPENYSSSLNSTLNHPTFLNILDNIYKNENSSFTGLLDV